MQLFLTDYASYNNGTQFEFGHWVDLEQFTDADEFLEYIKNHFEEADEKSPLPCGSKREEIMFTDYEGMPETLYSESMSPQEIENIFKLREFLSDNGIEDFENEGENLLHLWNEYCSAVNNEDEIYPFDDETLLILCGDDPMTIFQKGANAEINWGHDWLYLDGYANIHSTDDPSRHIDEAALFDWIIENKI